MPLYEYKCTNCGQVFEVRQRFSDSPLTQHEACGGGPVERLISAPALQFKGTGWYITDYARGGNSGNNAGKTDAKPASKSESKSDSGSSKSDSGSSGSSSSSKSSSSSSSDKK